LVNLFDFGFKTKLPKGSVVIETGGTKGKSRKIEKRQFYDLICARFGIEEGQIVSEYGMCELSSQAYDYVPLGRQIDFEDRVFKFPKWIQPRVASSLKTFELEGIGCLSINDPFRIDYPWTIKIQDMIELKGSEFKLLGRVPGAVLKGCSLLAENIVEQSNNLRTRKSIKKEFGVSETSRKYCPKKSKWFIEKFPDFISSKKFTDSMLWEFGSEKITKMVLESLRENCNELIDHPEKSVNNSLGLDAPKNTLLILPNNHSVAGFYPIIMAFLSGIELCIRIPEKFTHEDSSIHQIINFVNSYGVEKVANFRSVGPEFRIGSESKNHQFDLLIIFSSDKTIDEIKNNFAGQVIGFGNKINICLLDNYDKLKTSDYELIVNDFLNLRQKGCMSTRVIGFNHWSIEETSKFAANLAKLSDDAISSSLTAFEKAALDCLELEYRAKKITLLNESAINQEPNRRQVLLPYFDVTDLHDEAKIENVLADIPFVLPMVNFDGNFGNFLKFKGGQILSGSADSQAAKKIAEKTDPADAITALKPLGKSNTESWDGYFLSKPLFLFS